MAGLRHRLAPAIVAVSLLGMGTAAVCGPWRPISGGIPMNPLRVVVVNASRHNPSAAKATQDIMRQHGDLVVIAEGGALLKERLKKHYAFTAMRKGAEPLLFSRFPLHPLPYPPGLAAEAGVSRWGVTTSSGTVVVYAAHLIHPELRAGSFLAGFSSQREVVTSVVRALRAERSATLVVGDFNISDRSWGYRRLSSQLADAMRSGWAGPTYLRLRPLLLRIDHIFMPRRWCSQRSERFHVSGSDHRGVVTEAGPCRPSARSATSG